MAELNSLALSRLTALAAYLWDNPGIHVRDVAAHFDRTVRQVRRDVSVLIEAGFDDLLPGRTLELDMDAYLQHQTLTLRSPLGLEQAGTLTHEDLALLVHGLHAAAPTMSEEELAAVPSAIQKAALLAGLGPHEPLPSLEALGGTDPSGKLDPIRGALSQGGLIAFDYVSGAGRHSHRTVQPLALTFAGEGWLLEGISLEIGERRSFRVDRMDNLRQHARPPTDGDATAEAEAPSSRSTRVAAVLLDEQADWMAHETAARKVCRVPGGIRAEFDVWDDNWMRTELLLLADHVQGTEPSSVMTQASIFASRALLNWDAVVPEGGER